MFLKKLVLIALAMPVLAISAPVQISLTNGDSLSAELISQTKQTVTISHSVLGQMTISKAKIGEISLLQIVNTESRILKATEQTATNDDNDTGLFNTGLLVNWQRRLDVGVVGSAGKTKSLQVNAGFTADYDDDKTRISHKTAYFLAESEGERTDSSFYSTINKDWLIPDSPWFRFAGGRIDIDEFKDWDYRLNINAGSGYTFIDREDFLFLGRLGLSANQTFGGEREAFTPEGLLGVETNWQVNDHQQVKFANTLYPSLKDASEFRNLTSFDWMLDLDSLHGVALKLGLLNEYDSATEDGISKNDFKYTLSLSWTL